MDDIDYRAVVHYKTYPRFEKVMLVNEVPPTQLRILMKNRRTRREPSETPLDIKLLHPLLNIAAGRTGNSKTNTEDFRAYPSAGARYPLELYLVSFDVEGLEKGVYHFSPIDGSLEILWKNDYLETIDKILNGAVENFSKIAKAFLIITSIEDRTTYKYGNEGNVFPYIEAGYMGANIILLLEEARINTVIVGVPWCGDELGELLDINPMKEEVVSGIAVL